MLGAFGIAGEHEREDFPVLCPYQRALLRIAEHSPHRAFQMWPLRRDRLLDRAVTGQTIQRAVKINVGLDEGEDRSIGPSSRPAARARSAACAAAPRSSAARHPRHPAAPQVHRVRCEPDKVCESALGRFRNHQTTPARFLDQLLLLEQLQCMADRLSRDTERATELLLPKTLPRGERAIGNRLDQSLIGAIDQGGLKFDRLHQARSEFGIPYCQSSPKSKGGTEQTHRPPNSGSWMAVI